MVKLFLPDETAYHICQIPTKYLLYKIVTKIDPGRLIKNSYYKLSFFRVLTEGQWGGYFDIITLRKPRQITHRSSQPLLAQIN